MVSKVDTMWFPQDTTWFPHGCHVVYIWTPCVVEVTTWKPVQKTALHEANWLPCLKYYHLTLELDSDIGILMQKSHERFYNPKQ